MAVLISQQDTFITLNTDEPKDDRRENELEKKQRYDDGPRTRTTKEKIYHARILTTHTTRGEGKKRKLDRTGPKSNTAPMWCTW